MRIVAGLLLLGLLLGCDGDQTRTVVTARIVEKYKTEEYHQYGYLGNWVTVFWFRVQYNDVVGKIRVNGNTYENLQVGKEYEVLLVESRDGKRELQHRRSSD